MTPSKKRQDAAILNYFEDLEDPRLERNKLHLLTDILAIVLCGCLCGVDNFVQIQLWAESNEAWLKTFLKLPHGIPSHDTMGRVFSLLDPEEFQRRFVKWVQAVTGAIEGVVGIDGKTLRRSHDKGTGKRALHMVSAWSAENRMVLGQISTEEKSNEITAIPRLLECLDINGCIVTIDAMGAQKEIAADIVDKGAHYVLGLKGNQGLLEEAVERHFNFALQDGRKQASLKFHETTEKNGGRLEVRKVWVADASGLVDSVTQGWACLTSIARVESIRVVEGKESLEHRHYISSLPGLDAPQMANAIRSHWGIENQLHWTLDVVFNEDQCRVRKDHAAENMAVVRHIALGLHNKHGREVQINGKTRKTGLANRRQLASWHQAYREKLLGLLAEIT